MITNPVLPGFHPDPSTIRVGDRYVIATSTFEWFPGIALHTSDDLQHWQPVGHVLTRPVHLPLRGIGDSAGIWAPALSFHDDSYWVVYTIVRTMTGPHKDLDNYLVTAPDLAGPWSEPIYLNSSGFDPSLFHAADGRRYLINVNWDHRDGHFAFGGVLLQEYDHDQRSLVGEPSVIFASDVLMEGSHLFEHDGWFYLMLAEGGTGYNHGIRLARSRELRGPYVTDPEPLLTSRDDGTQPIQKAGHGQLVSTPSGETYVVHLGARPVMGPQGLRSPLGRETFLQQVRWTADGWLRLATPGHHPATEVAAPTGLPPVRPAPPAPREARGSLLSDPEWMSLRGPADATWVDKRSRPGWIRLRGRESLDSLFHQSLLARRLASISCLAEVTADAQPQHFTELAGLVVYYNTTGYHYLAVSHDEDLGRVLVIISSTPSGQVTYGPWPASDGELHLRAVVDGLGLAFSAAADVGPPSQLGPTLDLGPLSDEEGATLRFTGTMIGICVQDHARRRFTADFSDFRLSELGRS